MKSTVNYLPVTKCNKLSSNIFAKDYFSSLYDWQGRGLGKGVRLCQRGIKTITMKLTSFVVGQNAFLLGSRVWFYGAEESRNYIGMYKRRPSSFFEGMPPNHQNWIKTILIKTNKRILKWFYKCFRPNKFKRVKFHTQERKLRSAWKPACDKQRSS